MGRKITLAPHDSISELKFCYHHVKSAVYAQHLHIILLLKKAFSSKDITEITTISPRWIQSICDRYNKAKNYRIESKNGANG